MKGKAAKETVHARLPAPSLIWESLGVWFLPASLVHFYHIYLHKLGPAGPAFFLCAKGLRHWARLSSHLHEALLLLLLTVSVLAAAFSLSTPFPLLHFSLESPTDSETPRHLCEVACSSLVTLSHLCYMCIIRVPECAVAAVCRSEDPLSTPYGFLGLKSVFSLAANTYTHCCLRTVWVLISIWITFFLRTSYCPPWWPYLNPST